MQQIKDASSNFWTNLALYSAPAVLFATTVVLNQPRVLDTITEWGRNFRDVTYGQSKGTMYSEIRSTISEVITGKLYLTGRFGVVKMIAEAAEPLLVISITESSLSLGPEKSNVQIVRIPVLDVPESYLKDHFNAISSQIQQALENDVKVVVHCEYGVSRSATLVLAYLMKEQHMTLTEAHDYLLEKRFWINPNPGFWSQLLEYETEQKKE